MRESIHAEIKNEQGPGYRLVNGALSLIFPKESEAEAKHYFFRMKSIRALWAFLFCFVAQSTVFASDTIPGFAAKVRGEEIIYFSPLHEFAPAALLTRCNGESPISWKAPVYSGKKDRVIYRLLMGHSTGTSGADRSFRFQLNGEEVFDLVTPKGKRGPYQLEGAGNSGIKYTFVHTAHDIHQDGFGWLWIEVPAARVREDAVFEVTGLDAGSRDWLMIFMYRPGFQVIAQPTSLVTRKEGRRQLNLFIDNPFGEGTEARVRCRGLDVSVTLKEGYNKLHFPAWDPEFIGADTLHVELAHGVSWSSQVELLPMRHRVFHLIHHSHTDIGYSHLQPEVERLQDDNIAVAIRWFQREKNRKEIPYWHVESLWAVENFLRKATLEQEQAFVEAVRSGHLVLSANFANLMTGLCREEELEWMLEYAQRLQRKYGFVFRNAMITDVPGISWSGLNAYVRAGIPYLCLGPNYMPAFPDKGDRVGNLLREQGDKAFYWKPDRNSDRKLLVWTAAKGYSWFHGIPDAEKRQAWEKRISEYGNELEDSGYPWEIVRLHYTKKSDNGPVDTTLCSFVADWNERFTSPTLNLSSVDSVFQELERRHGSELPEMVGEISPYWEDGAYSTAAEEMATRVLVQRTLDLEGHLRRTGQREKWDEELYALHRHLVLFHEHTWGSWCSISDPESEFTTRQWEIKRSFLDSARVDFDRLALLSGFVPQHAVENVNARLEISGFEVDTLSGGLCRIFYQGANMLHDDSQWDLFQPVYRLGAAPLQDQFAVVRRIEEVENSELRRIVAVTMDIPSMPETVVSYTLWKKERRLTADFHIEKLAVREKESLHLAIPFAREPSDVRYGSARRTHRLSDHQLPGSNRDFICVEQDLILGNGSGRAMHVRSEALCLYELGSMVDETPVNGAKVWKREISGVDPVFAYVLNNYWHTNFKAWQEGPLQFRIECWFEESEP